MKFYLDLYDIDFNDFFISFEQNVIKGKVKDENFNILSDTLSKDRLCGITYNIVNEHTYFTQKYHIKQAILDIFNIIFCNNIIV